MSFRSKLRIDYAVLQNTGIKVIKYSDREILTEGMANLLILNELNLREDLRHSLEIYVLDGLESKDEISEGV